MQLGSMLRVEGVEGNEIRGGDWLGGRLGVSRVGMGLAQFFENLQKAPSRGQL